ncbi:hydrogenase 4 subunit B [Acidiferrobacter sp.]|uniref:hydrogenase 4 subunit B n=1 Tax=Acidiferrobacter sp. TaxID=1872107 RepID=UPI00261CEFBC|nr:hydrogenase 4 subunit B [Acidiferrobacter sp.]
MNVSIGLPWGLILSALVLWSALAFASPFTVRFPRIAPFIFPLGAVGALCVATAGLLALHGPPVATISPLGLPGLPFHGRLDALSGFFLILFGLTTVAISLDLAGYRRHEHYPTAERIGAQYHILLASLTLVFVAADSYSFMIAWEAMALSSYLLVITDHLSGATRRAGFLYLLIEHVGALALLAAFAILIAQGPAGAPLSFTFTALHAAHPDAAVAGLVFILAFLGFGAKAGLIPLHVWLPQAHPVAPSPISALLSSVLLKVGIYGLLRVAFIILPTPAPWWGLTTLSIGLMTALLGALSSAVQNDMKRLLAYSSVENIGLITAGIGLALLFSAYGLKALATLALIAALYHCLNHAFFKGLLFLGTGSVLHATGERRLSRLGGLIHRMPQTALLMLIGTLAIAGVPPLNGFVSEWLTLQAFLKATALPRPYLAMGIPLGAALTALVAGLAGYVMVKFYGIVFLGRPRDAQRAQARESGRLERAGLGLLALLCLLAGVWPAGVIALIRPAAHLLSGANAMITTGDLGARVGVGHATYVPWVLWIALGAIALAAILILRVRAARGARRVPVWNCGHPLASARIQDTAEGFGQPIRDVFAAFLAMRRHRPAQDDRVPRYASTIEDRFWQGLYQPAARGFALLFAATATRQPRRIAISLLGVLMTLIGLLVLAP